MEFLTDNVECGIVKNDMWLLKLHGKAMNNIDEGDTANENKNCYRFSSEYAYAGWR